MIIGKQFDQERALYHLQDEVVANCIFAGPADGESALKEARNVTLDSCTFRLRYPLWHVEGFRLNNCSMDDKARAAIWYASNGVIDHSTLGGIKALRECRNVRILDSHIDSPEFGWKCRNITLEGTQVTAEYLFLDSADIHLNQVQMKGKYSFQYVQNLLIEDSYLDTKDAFWHAKNVTVRNSTIKGEYLAWFSQGLTLINCHIIGTQPLCYCKDLTLINCTTEGCDLSFEYSAVNAEIKGEILSVKNPRSGRIVADGYGEIVREGSVMESECEIIKRAL
jgi:hypothetical protein